MAIALKTPLFADISSFQNPTLVDWKAYAAWARQWDGIGRVLIRDDQGVGVKDSAFEAFWAGAVSVGLEEIYCYHYAYPNLHPGAVGAIAEAKSMQAIIGPRLRAHDKVMLDLEQNESSAWALAFGQQLVTWHPTASKPVLYDSLSHIKAYLTAPELAQVFDLGLADWTFDPNSRPAAPAPWKAYAWLQWTDRDAVPGLPGLVDCNVFLGGDPLPTNFREQQAADVWGKTVAANTGIHAAWLQAYERGVVCGPPLGPEFASVNWAGDPIVRQEFAHAWIEYYAQTATGQPAGSHHGYTQMGTSLVTLW